VALADILVFRFVFRVSAMETLGWIAFAFLQARPDALHPPLKLQHEATVHLHPPAHFQPMHAHGSYAVVACW
jgi:hypothetical protein